MKDTLQAGIEHTFRFAVSDRKTVPALYPESEEFQQMPEVHERFVIDRERFSDKINQKRENSAT